MRRHFIPRSMKVLLLTILTNAKQNLMENNINLHQRILISIMKTKHGHTSQGHQKQ